MARRGEEERVSKGPQVRKWVWLQASKGCIAGEEVVATTLASPTSLVRRTYHPAAICRICTTKQQQQQQQQQQQSSSSSSSRNHVQRAKKDDALSRLPIALLLDPFNGCRSGAEVDGEGEQIAGSRRIGAKATRTRRGTGLMSIQLTYRWIWC